MSTSDQQGDRPLTRKQLREIRLTGATPVIGEDEAAAAAKQQAAAPSAPLPRPAAQTEIPPAPLPETQDSSAAAPLTRRQARAQERLRTASVPVVEPETVEEPSTESVSDADPAPSTEQEPAETPAESATEAAADDAAVEADAEADESAAGLKEILSESDDEVEQDASETDDAEQADDAEQDAEGDEDPDDADATKPGERPVVGSAFGTQVLSGSSEVPDFTPSFDELITSDSGGSHRAPSTLIFTHPGEGALSGPVAATGEVLITGSYELPHGLGSQGHAHGTTDGKDVDAVLIDGELPPASSPTPIAASSAVSTIKPAGEVIRPPAPEKGNKLMLTLAITAGGLALALAVALIFAFTTNLLG